MRGEGGAGEGGRATEEASERDAWRAGWRRAGAPAANEVGGIAPERAGRHRRTPAACACRTACPSGWVCIGSWGL